MGGRNSGALQDILEDAPLEETLSHSHVSSPSSSPTKRTASGSGSQQPPGKRASLGEENSEGGLSGSRHSGGGHNGGGHSEGGYSGDWEEESEPPGRGGDQKTNVDDENTQDGSLGTSTSGPHDNVSGCFAFESSASKASTMVPTCQLDTLALGHEA